MPVRPVDLGDGARNSRRKLFVNEGIERARFTGIGTDHGRLVEFILGTHVISVEQVLAGGKYGDPQANRMRDVQFAVAAGAARIGLFRTCEATQAPDTGLSS